MKQGVLIYAHNNREVDYALMALISGGLARKNLEKPVSLVSDITTVEWMEQSKILDTANKIFENIIIVNKPETTNQRRLYDGSSSSVVPFANTNRDSVWNITPYDRTLLIDSDFLILSNNLSKYWNSPDDVMIGQSINDIYSDQRLGYLDRHVADTGVKLYWATTVMFTKNSTSKIFFDMVSNVKENYKHYGDIFRFDPRQYRNDIAFSVAKHILDGYQELTIGKLPPVLSALDRDILYSVENNKLTFLIDYKLNNTYCAATLSEVDIHVMNKQSIYRNKQSLLEMI